MSTQSPLGTATPPNSTEARPKLFHSERGGLAVRGTGELKIDGFCHAGRGLVRNRDFAALAGRGVAGIERVNHHEAVFSGSLRSFFAARAAREVRQLLRRAVVPELFEYGIGPTFRGGSFFDGVAIAIFAEGGQCVAHVQIGVGHAAFAAHFYPVVHAATTRPTVFDEPDGAIGEFENAKRTACGFGFVVVNVGAHLAINGFYWGASEEKITKGDAVTAEVHERAAAGAIHVPEPRAVWAEVFSPFLN